MLSAIGILLFALGKDVYGWVRKEASASLRVKSNQVIPGRFLLKKRFPLVLLFVLLLVPGSVTAQSKCGWGEPPATDRLPANVEAIIAQLPGGFDSGEVVQQMNDWYRNCDGTAMRKAIFELRRAAGRYRTDQAVAALLGTALMHGPEVQLEGAVGMTNRPIYKISNSEREGARLLAKAAVAPGLDAAGLELANVAIASRHGPTVELALDALREITGNGGTPAHWRLIADLYFIEQKYDSAIASGMHAFERGDSTAMHATAVARLMVDADTAAAARAYFAGLEASAAMQLYYDDISYLLLPSDTLEWSALDASKKADWIRQQWEWRATTSGQSVAARLKEHFVRLAYAMEHYPRMSFSGPPAISGVVRDGSTRKMSIDDRGLIYVRHGEPDRIIRMGIGSADDTRSAWGYRSIGTGGALFEFSRNDCSTGASGPSCVPVADYFMSAPLPCGLGDKPDRTYLDYAQEIMPYAPALAGSFVGCWSAMTTGNSLALDGQRGRDAQNRMTSLQEGLVALKTETARTIEEPISALMRTYAMRDRSNTVLVAAAMLDGSMIKPAEGTLNYGLEFRLSVEHPETRTAEKVDTTLTFTTPAPMTPGQVASVRITSIAAPAADATVRFTVRNANDPSQGQIITTARAIPDLSGDRFALSDLVVAAPVDGTWVRGNVRLAPLPSHEVAEGEPFRLFHEIYGAADGDSVSVQITIAPGESESVLSSIRSLVQRRSAQQLTFSDRLDVDAVGTARLSREVATDLEPGRYVIIVNVRNPRLNASAEARTDLVILKQE
jgi:hypothetical protein